MGDCQPTVSFSMIQFEEFAEGPIQMLAKIGYLLIDPFQRVADNPPGGTSSIPCPQCGQDLRAAESPLMRL